MVHCRHYSTRCIHGDEIWRAAKWFPFRWWKEPVIRRQRCTECHEALDRDAICTYYPEQHSFSGNWVERPIVVQYGTPPPLMSERQRRAID